MCPRATVSALPITKTRLTTAKKLLLVPANARGRFSLILPFFLLPAHCFFTLLIRCDGKAFARQSSCPSSDGRQLADSEIPVHVTSASAPPFTRHGGDLCDDPSDCRSVVRWIGCDTRGCPGPRFVAGSRPPPQGAWSGKLGQDSESISAPLRPRPGLRGDAIQHRRHPR